MKLSIIIPYKSDGGQRDRLFRWVSSRWQILFPDAEIVLGRNKDDPFSRGAARNDGFLRCAGDTIVLADADTAINPGQIDAAVGMVWDGVPWVLPYQTYFNLTEEYTETVLGFKSTVELVEPDVWEHKLESWAGVLVMSREAFFDVHGYDERFTGWGFEDNSFQKALDTLCGPFSRVEGNVQHLWHEAPHESTWGQPNFRENQMLHQRYSRAYGDKDAMLELIKERS